ncbi:MAG: mechanosensitive ion channel family protein [bacterium]|nr:mechanosensitive ion channel family protein [bacterium]
MFDFLTDKRLIENGLLLLQVVTILVVSFLVARMVKRLMLKREPKLKGDRTRFKFLAHLISGMIYFVGLLMAIFSIPSVRLMATPIFAGSGVLAIIIGITSRHASANIVSGIFISMFKPFRLGDRLRFVGKDFIGIVEDITLRHTVIRTFDNRRIIVPNSVISSEILENSNIFDPRILKFFEIKVAFDTDIDKAMEIMREEALKHRKFVDNRTPEQIAENEPAVIVRMVEINEYSIMLRANVWVKDPSDAFVLGCDLNKSVKERFDKEGIEIPLPYHSVIVEHKKD